MPVKSYKFKYLGGLLVLTATITGKNTYSPLEVILALDTASTKTIIKPDNMELIGYTGKDKGKTIGITTGSKTERGFEMQLINLTCLGHSWENPIIVAKKLPQLLFFIDGLIGLDFFQTINKKLTIDFHKQQLQI